MSKRTSSKEILIATILKNAKSQSFKSLHSLDRPSTVPLYDEDQSRDSEDLDFTFDDPLFLKTKHKKRKSTKKRANGYKSTSIDWTHKTGTKSKLKKKKKSGRSTASMTFSDADDDEKCASIPTPKYMKSSKTKTKTKRYRYQKTFCLVLCSLYISVLILNAHSLCSFPLICVHSIF